MRKIKKYSKEYWDKFDLDMRERMFKLWGVKIPKYVYKQSPQKVLDYIYKKWEKNGRPAREISRHTKGSTVTITCEANFTEEAPTMRMGDMLIYPSAYMKENNNYPASISRV